MIWVLDWITRWLFWFWPVICQHQLFVSINHEFIDKIIDYQLWITFHCFIGLIPTSQKGNNVLIYREYDPPNFLLTVITFGTVVFFLKLEAHRKKTLDTKCLPTDYNSIKRLWSKSRIHSGIYWGNHFFYDKQRFRVNRDKRTLFWSKRANEFAF